MVKKGDLESFSLIYQAQVLLTFSLSGSLNVAPTICKTMETVLPRKTLYREFKISSMNSNKSSSKSTVAEGTFIPHTISSKSKFEKLVSSLDAYDFT